MKPTEQNTSFNPKIKTLTTTFPDHPTWVVQTTALTKGNYLLKIADHEEIIETNFQRCSNRQHAELHYNVVTTLPDVRISLFDLRVHLAGNGDLLNA